jgi:hypothetical protein
MINKINLYRSDYGINQIAIEPQNTYIIICKD